MNTPSQDYITCICSLYKSSYDDRVENTSPPTAGNNPREPGKDWIPGTTFTELLVNKEAYDAMAHAVNPYSDGHACECERFANILVGKEYCPWEP